MAVNSSNSSDPSAQVAQLIQASQTAAANNDKKGAAADLAQVKSLLAANPGAFDKDTLDKANNEITLLNGDYTQGLSLDGATQDQHMAGFVSQVQALGITLSGSTATGSASSASSTKNLGASVSGTSSTSLTSNGASSSTPQGARLSSSTTSGSGTTSGASASTVDYTKSGMTATGTLTSVAQAKVLKDFKAIADGIQAGTASSGDKVDTAVTDLQTQLASIYGTGAVPSAVQSKYSALMTLRDQWASGNTAVGSSITTAKNALADSISQNGGGDSGWAWGNTSVLADGTAAPTTASTSSNAGSSSTVSSSSGTSSTTSGSSSATVDYTKAGTTATGGNTYVVQAKMIADYKKIRDAVKGGTAQSGYGVDSAVSDLQSQLKSLYGSAMPAAVQTQYAALSSLRDKWAGGDASVGTSLNDASNKLAASISANGGGGSAYTWGDQSVNADGSAAGSSTSSASSSSTDSSATTSANHDWKDAGVSFSQSDITAAASASPPNYSKLGGYLDSLGGKLDGKLVSKQSKTLLGNLKDALQAKPLVKQDVADAFAKFSSNGIKNNANSDQKKAYDAVMSGILSAIGESGNSSVDKRGKEYVGDKYAAKI